MSPAKLKLTVGEAPARVLTALPQQDASEVSRLPEGWPSTIAARFRRLRQGMDAAGPESAVTDPEGELAAAIWQQVLLALPPRYLEFAIRISFLDNLGPDLVSAVTDEEDAWHSLEQLALCGLVDVDRGHTANDEAGRFLPLVKSTLFRRLQSRGDQFLRPLRERAALYLVSTGDARKALRHAARGRDPAFISQIFLKAGGLAIGLREGHSELRAALDLLPPAAMVEPRVQAANAFALIKAGRIGVALELLRNLTGPDRPQDKYDPLLARDIRVVELLATAAGLPACGPATSDQRASFEASPADEYALMQGVIYNKRCLKAFRAGRLDDALLCGETAQHFYRAADALNGLANMHLHAARIHRARGDQTHAFASLQVARQLFAGKDGPDTDELALVDVQLSALLVDQGDLPGAQSLCETALPRLEAGERFWETLYDGYSILAHARMFAGDIAAGLAILGRGLEHARLNGFAELDYLLRLRLLRHSLLNSPDDVGGEDIVDKEPPGAPHWTLRQARCSAKAYLLARENKVQAALLLIETARDEFLNAGLLRGALQLGLDRVAILERTGDRQGALAHLGDCLALGEQIGVIFPFIDRRSVIHTVLVQADVELTTAKRDGDGPTFCAKVLSKLFDVDRLHRLSVSFSAKEHAIMQGLALGRQNKEIARDVGVSPETIRFHLKNIYSKLGVNERRSNRLIAAEFARRRAQG